MAFRIREASYYKNWNEGKEDLTDKYAGQTCIIVANGPSLNDVPIPFLKKYPSFGTNNIYLKKDFTPTFYTILGFSQVNTPKKLDYCRPIIMKVKNAFVNRAVYPYFDYPHVYAIHSIDWVLKRRHRPKTRFSKQPLRTLGIGFTNTYILFQLAYWMGFTKVYCVGLDNDYSRDPKKLHFYKNDPRYACEPFMGREEHQAGSFEMFKLALEAYSEDGRKIININGVNKTPFQTISPNEVW